MTDQDAAPSLAHWQPHPPPGWEPVAEVCRTVRLRLDDLTTEIVKAITDEIPDYGRVNGVRSEDLFASVFDNVGMMLSGIAEHRRPRLEELEIRKELGRRRAQQGIPIDALVSAYHVGYRELWAALVEEAIRADGLAQSLLLQGGATVWGWIHDVTSSVADAYKLELSQQEASDARARSHFLEQVMWTPDASETRSLAIGFGFDPDGTFRCLAALAHPSDDNGGSSSSFNSPDPAIVVRCSRGRIVISVTQPRSTPPSVRQRTPRTPRRTTVNGVYGIGLEREGLTGARQSAIDAELALELALRRGRPCDFEAAWLESILLAHERALTPITEPVLAVAEAQPHLAGAAKSYFEADMSLAAAARAMHLAPNSVRHRLNQWKSLTGLDPWSVSGLIQSVLIVGTLKPEPTA